MKAKEVKARKPKGEVKPPSTPLPSSTYARSRTSFLSYGEGEQEPKNEGYNYRTSTALIDNVIAKKEVTLFSDMENLPQGATPINASITYQNAKGKKVTLSPRQLKIVLALAQIVDAYRNNEEVAKYIKNLPNKIEWGEGKNLPTPVRATIDLYGFAKHIYGASRIGTKQVDYIKKDLIDLSTMRQVFKVTDSKGVTHELNTSAIRAKVYQATSGTGERLCTLASVEVEDIFLYNLNTEGGYQLSPNTILSLWNETGVNTELFSMLLFLLLRVRGNKVKHANSLSMAKRKELLKLKKPIEEIDEEVEAYKRRLLTYSESIGSILERLSQNPYTRTQEKRGRVYTSLRKEKLTTDLQQATDALKGMGIITDFHITGGTTGEEVCNFVLNDKWLQEQAERQRALLPPEEVKAIEEAIAKEKGDTTGE